MEGIKKKKKKILKINFKKSENTIPPPPKKFKIDDSAFARTQKIKSYIRIEVVLEYSGGSRAFLHLQRYIRFSFVRRTNFRTESRATKPRSFRSGKFLAVLATLIFSPLLEDRCTVSRFVNEHSNVLPSFPQPKSHECLNIRTYTSWPQSYEELPT